ncbi:MAG: methyltransferase domain-containing protein [Symploca sp. SIO2G7]|nr:methyltransferase domain-containing protein [Symploca sp. SIO2G7]
MTDSKSSYTQEWRMAAYLEAEWSDFLFGSSKIDDTSFDPLVSHVHPSFYQEIASLTKQCLEEKGILPQRYLDIGGSTGRTVYEMYHCLSSLNEIVLVEPSSKFCEWSRKLLLKSDDLGYVPVVCTPQKPDYAKPLNRPKPLQKSPAELIYIYEAFAESVPRPREYFDLITCLNVLDRHPNPKSLIQILHNLLTPSGVVVFASPMDSDDTYTPDRSQWISNLNSLFEDRFWDAVADTNVFYEFRYSNRKFTRFSSQVVVKQKR